MKTKKNCGEFKGLLNKKKNNYKNFPHGELERMYTYNFCITLRKCSRERS